MRGLCCLHRQTGYDRLVRNHLMQGMVRGTLPLGGMSLLWGSGWLVPQPSLPPFATASLVFALAALAVGLGSLATQPGVSASLRTSLTLGLAMLGAPAASLLLAGLHGAGSWVPLLGALLPLFTAFSLGRWSPVTVVPVGAVLVLLNGTVPFTWSKAIWAVPVLAAVGLQAFAFQFAARQLRGVSACGLLRSMACQSMAAAALLVLCSVLFDASPRFAWAVPASLLPAILGTALPYALLYFLLARGVMAPHQAATTQWLQFLVAVLEGAALARVWPSWQSCAAILAVLVCTGIVLQPEENSRPPHLFGSPL